VYDDHPGWQYDGFRIVPVSYGRVFIGYPAFRGPRSQLGTTHELHADMTSYGRKMADKGKKTVARHREYWEYSTITLNIQRYFVN